LIFFWLLFFQTKKKKLDIDECLTNNGGCDEHSSCINTIGSYKCECNEGYSGDGMSCSLSTTNPTSTSSFSNENQNKQAVGIGVGVTFGLLAFIFFVLLILFFIKRRKVRSLILFIWTTYQQLIHLIIATKWKTKNWKRLWWKTFNDSKYTILFFFFFLLFNKLIFKQIIIIFTIVGNMTLMNTKLEVSMPGFMKIEYDQIRKEQKIGGGGFAPIYKGVILDNSLKEVFFFIFFFFNK